MATHYVDNKQLYSCIVAYRNSVLDAREKGLPKPIIPNYIGECILMIANRLSTKPNFINYSYREEMVSDGVENCICYIDNFDPVTLENSMLLNELFEQGEFSEQEFVPTHMDVNDDMYDFIKTFEDNLMSKKKKRAKKGVERFIEEDVVQDDTPLENNLPLEDDVNK